MDAGNVRGGQKLSRAISASEWNEMRALRRKMQKDTGATTGVSFDGSRDGIVLVRNQSGQTLDQYDVVGLSDPPITPDDNLLVFQGGLMLDAIVPTDSHAGKFGVMLAPCESGGLAPAIIDGVTAVKLTVESEDDDFAEASDGDKSTLHTASSGSAQILWKPEGTGEKWGIIRIGNRFPNLRGWIEFTLVAGLGGSSAEVTVDAFWGRDPGEETVVVYDHQGLFKAARPGAKGIAVWDSKRLRYVVVDGQSLAGWIHVTLTSDMAAETSGAFTAEATLDGYHGTQQDVQGPETGTDDVLTVYGIEGISDSLKAGDKVLAFYSSEENKYYCLPKAGGEAKAIHFEITDYGTPIKAKVLDFYDGSDPGDAANPEDPANEVTILDPTQQFPRMLIAADSYSNEGSKGYGIRTSDGVYLAMTCEQETPRYIGTTVSGSGSGDPVDVTIDGVLSIAPMHMRTDEETVPAYNPHAFDFDGGALVRIEWKIDGSGNGRWEIYQVDCPEP